MKTSTAISRIRIDTKTLINCEMRLRLYGDGLRKEAQIRISARTTTTLHCGPPTKILTMIAIGALTKKRRVTIWQKMRQKWLFGLPVG
jgi:hypothetical protein